MKTLIMLSAFPGCGKSTWAKQYQAEHENVYIVSSDQVRAEVAGSYENRSKQDEVWLEFSRRIRECAKIKDVTVIIDALNDKNEIRKKYLDENPDFDKYILVLFPSTYERSLALNNQRPKPYAIDEPVFKMLFEKFEQPNEEIKKRFNEIIEVKF